MAVKITKPEINVREKLAELDKPSGIAGEAMLRAETPQEQFNLIGAGRRNLVINGDFQVSQRGDFTSSQTLGTSFQFYVDRWKIYAFSNDVGYIQHFLDQSLPDGSYANTLRITSGDNDLLAPLVHNIENHKIVWGRDFTLSFWYKSTSDNTYNLWNGTTQTHFLLPNTNGAWVKYEQTYNFPGNGANLRIEFYSHTATFPSGAYLELANIQLELGKVATPFEHRSYGEELALCQRYFYKAASRIVTSMKSSGSSTGKAAITMSFPVTMRATPTLAFTDGAGTATKISYHSSGVSSGVNHGLAIHYAEPYATHAMVYTASYTGYDCYITNLTASAEL